jgi:hygromycin-B 7''-O-kinase
MLFPEIRSLDDYRPFFADRAAQRPAFEQIAKRHNLARSELDCFTEGTHLVWGTSRHVIKLFAPLWAEDEVVEVEMLRRLTGTGVRAPQLEAVGEFGGWTYVVIERLPGRSIGSVWEQTTEAEKVALARQMGELIASLHQVSTASWPIAERPPMTVDTLVAERLAHVEQDQRDRGADDDLASQLRVWLDGMAEVPNAKPVLLHADLTGDHFLVQDGRITGIIDFADAFVGPWTYEFAAPGTITRGSRAAQRALFEGTGREPTGKLGWSLVAWTVLHRYAHLAYLLRDHGYQDLEAWLSTVWIG